MSRVISRKYEEIAQLGHGGQGVVYKVRHVEHNTILAVKALPSYLLENQEMVARFEQEALVMSRLHHRNIVRVLGIGRDDTLKLHYFVMEYIQGKTLRQYLQEKGPLPLPEVLEISRQIASALDYAHSQTPPVIHRDIKPANVMIEDLSGRVVVLDFGIAKELAEGDLARTKTGVMIGTWKYSSPEQLRHDSLTGSADVYSLGLVMYEMYTGTQFFAGLDEPAILGKVLHDPQEHEPYFARPTPPAFVALVTKAIAKSRDRRYRRMADLLNDLEACWWALDETKTVVLQTPGPSVPQPERVRSDVEEIEEQIRKLEAERQRRLVVSIQEKTREAREQADRAGARQWAATLFQQGLSQEEQGEALLREGQHARAQETYQTAADLFARAREEAATAAVFRQAELSRQDAATAKADAERYSARERARTFYGRALARQAQAEELWEQKAYQPAGQTYAEARSLFEDARDLAYRETLKEEAEAAQASAQAAKEAALGESAELLVAGVFQEAALSEQQAKEALGREEFTQARELSEIARQKYEQAQRQAQRELRRRQTFAAAQQALEARQRAEATESSIQTHPLYRQGIEEQQQAEAYFTANDYTQALLAYGRARASYEQAERMAEREQQQKTVANARQQLELARVAAERSGAQERLPARMREIQQLAQAAQQAEEQEEFVQAAALYVQAAQRFEQLRQETLAHIAQERADVARQGMQQAKEQGFALRDWAESLWTEAEAEEQRAERAYQACEYEQAVEHYQQAGQAYLRARKQAEAERKRQEENRAAAAVALLRQAERSRQETAAAKAAAHYAGAEKRASERYRQALALEARAEELWAQQAYQEAIQAYSEARQVFVVTRDLAFREGLKEEALRAQAQMQTLREATLGAGAEKFAGVILQEAVTITQQAQRALEHGEFAQARECYEAACRQYERAGQQAQRQALREIAEIARATMQAAREAAVLAKTEEFATSDFQEITTTVQRADAALAAGEFEQARALYDAAAQQYRLAQRGSQTEQQRRQAEAAAQHTRGAQQRAVAIGARSETHSVFRKAAEAQQRADVHFVAGEYAQATQDYEQARAWYEDAVRAVEQEQQQRETTSARQQMEGARAAAEEVGAAVLFAAQAEEIQQLARAAQQSEARGEYSQATTLYEEGAQRFAQLRQRALAQRAKERTEAIRQQMREVKAQGSALRRWAEKNWAAADEQETQAERFYQARHYEQAAEAYRQAIQAYGEAQRTADEARRQYEAELRAAARRQAERLRQEMSVARTEAENAGAQDRAATLYSRALRQHERAEELEKREAYQEAAQAYGETRHAFEEARDFALREALREEAEAARQQMQVVKTQGISLREWAETLWAEAQAQETQADQVYQAREYARAAGEYQQAEQVYAQAKARAEAKQQAAVAAALQQTEHARQQVEKAKAEAERAGARERARPLYSQASTLQTQADAYWKRQAYQQATQGYEEAARIFQEARDRVRRQLLQEETEAARTQAQAAKDAAVNEQAETLARTAWQAAVTAAQQADVAIAQGEFIQARELYHTAYQKYQQAQQQARGERQRRQVAEEEERRRQQALGTRQQAEQNRKAADQGEAQRYALDPYTQASQAMKEGEQSFTAKNWPEAVAQFGQACELFAKALDRARYEKAKQAAEAAREKILTVHQEVHKERGAELFPQQFEEASSLLLKADRAFQEKDFAVALAGFERSALVFQQIRQDTTRHEQREEAERTKARALELQQKTLMAKGRQQRQATKVLAHADRLFEQGNYPQAQASYEEVTSLLVALQQQLAAEAVAASVPKEVISPPSLPPEQLPRVVFPYARYSLLGVTLLFLAVAVYVVNPFRHPVGPILQPEAKTPPRPSAPETPREKEPIPTPEKELTRPVLPEDKSQTPSLPVPAPQTEPQAPVPPVTPPAPPQELAKPTLPPPSLPQPPVISRVTPEPGSELLLKEGQSLTFAVTTESLDKDLLRYAWRLDGKEQRTKSEKWTYQPGFDEGGEKPRAVEVVVSDQAGQTVKKLWQVRVQNVNRPPTITVTSPRTGAVEVATGKVQDFAIEASDPDRDDRLAYVWSLDGQEVARGKRWQFHAPADEGSHRVAVEIVDQEGLKKQQEWNVLVKALLPPPEPPVWGPVQPREEKVSTQAGQSLDFSVVADLPGRRREEKSTLRYQWSVNGTPFKTTETGQFRFTETRPGTYHLTVVAIGPEGLKSTSRAWTIEIRPLAVVPPPPPVQLQLSEAEVRNWLETYRHAWEERNVNMLVTLGAITSQDLAPLDERLRAFRDFRVALQDVEIHREGTQATVSFTRVDTMDGKPLPHPRRTLTIEKREDGRIVIRK